MTPSQSPPPVARRRIALGTMGGAEKLETWVALLSALPDDVRDGVSFFYSAFKGDLNATVVAAAGPALASALEQRGTSWTQGRNLLAQAMYAEEVRRGVRFDYWVLSDGDALVTFDCYGCAQTTAPDLSGPACCTAYLLRDVLLSYSFATVSSKLHQFEWMFAEGADYENSDGFFFRDCGDAMVQAFHRDAAPVALPYLTQLDAESWWASQAMLFFFTQGCLEGGNVFMARHLRERIAFAEHTEYPRGRNQELEFATVSAAFPGLVPDIVRQKFEAGNVCEMGTNPVLLGVTETQFSRADAAEHRSAVAPFFRHKGWHGEWSNSTAYAKCYAQLLPRFIQEVGRGVPEARRSYARG